MSIPKANTSTGTNRNKNRCAHPCCEKYGCFGFAKGSREYFCAEHRSLGMVNVLNARCEYESEGGCTVQPYFNFPGCSRPRYCKRHRLVGMVDVKNISCNHPKCTRQAYYNYPDQPVRWCRLHCQPGMKNLKATYCAQEQCGRRRKVGFPGLKPMWCRLHAPPGSIINPRRRCEIPGCHQIALFGAGGINQRCELHQTDGDEDLVLHRCTACFLPRQFLVEDICADCANRPLHSRLRKQRQVKSAFDKAVADKILPMYMSYDAPVLKAENCGNERPDFVWEAGTHRVIVEVDEDQHRTYPPECDRTRMINVTQAMGLPCIWIRYNPDTYHCHQGPLPDHMRLRHLIETTRLALKQIPQSTTDTLRVKKLFFDNNESSVFEFIPCI